MRTSALALCMSLTVAGLVSALPVPEAVTPSTDASQRLGNTPINMVMLHFPGPQTGEDQDDKAHDRKTSTPPAKSNGFAIVSSSKTSNFAVVTPLQSRSETEDTSFVKRAIDAAEGSDVQLIKRAPLTITITPIFRQTSGLLRSYVSKPAGRAMTRVSNHIRESNRRAKMDERWARDTYDPHGTQGWHGERFYGRDRMRQDWWKME